MNAETSVVKTFINEEFGEIRTVLIDGVIWFVGKDVATALGYSNPRDALAKHVDPEDKETVNLNTVAKHDDTVTNRDGIAGNPNVTLINESGLYSLIFSSKLSSAKKFRRWVTSEVLPSIRKTGNYNANGTYSGNSDFPPEMSKLWLNEKSAEALIQIAKLTKSQQVKDRLLKKATSMLVDEDLFHETLYSEYSYDNKYKI